jgi:hypothetical protein
MTLLAVGYLATDVWLYTSPGLRLSDRALLDVGVTLSFILLGAITYAATGGNDDSA